MIRTLGSFVMYRTRPLSSLTYKTQRVIYLTLCQFTFYLRVSGT